MIDLPYARLTVIAGCAAACFGAGWTLKGWRADAEIADLKAQHAQAVADATEAANAELVKARQREGELTTKIDKVVSDAQSVLALISRDADRAAFARGGLLDAARAVASRCGAGSLAGVTSGGPSAPSAGDLLSVVLERIDGTAGVLATALDRSYAAGRACERSYDAAREALK